MSTMINFEDQTYNYANVISCNTLFGIFKVHVITIDDHDFQLRICLQGGVYFFFYHQGGVFQIINNLDTNNNVRYSCFSCNMETLNDGVTYMNCYCFFSPDTPCFVNANDGYYSMKVVLVKKKTRKVRSLYPSIYFSSQFTVPPNSCLD